MAFYKYPANLAKHDDGVFDAIHVPGAITPFSGIYRCTSCGFEDARNQGDPLRPQNHGQHAIAKGPIRWWLAADHRLK